LRGKYNNNNNNNNFVAASHHSAFTGQMLFLPPNQHVKALNIKHRIFIRENTHKGELN